MDRMRWICALAIVVVAHAAMQGERTPQQGDVSLAISTDANAASRFVAVHGREAAVFGYASSGLEAWVYPFQIFSKYRVSFRLQGATSEVDGLPLLRRIDYRPDSVTRTYIGADYLVRETLFVPVEGSTASLEYEVSSVRPLQIIARFVPVLNLMWPGGTGGQSTGWEDDCKGFVLAEPEHGVRAVVASPEVASHDTVANSTQRGEQEIALAMQPRATPGGGALAHVLVALDTEGRSLHGILQDFEGKLTGLREAARDHYDAVTASAIHVETPDADVNRALAWANVALDQAWVCNPKLGCGIVGGYGPSRAQRRPQYDWYFAGDGLVIVRGLLAAGQYERARRELEFILKYQDAKSGMIWHEISQSAGYIDWSKFPYMFVHVDISFDFVEAVAGYLRVTGDAEFAREHWDAIAAAYRYCRSVVRDRDHLPHIPADKEGGNEQERPDDDLGLSSSWIAASDSFAEIAEATGHPEVVAEAREAARLSRKAVAERYWNAQAKFWYDGHTASGEPIYAHRSGAAGVLLQDVFDARQREAALDQLSSARFVTDWGMRGVASDSPVFEPYSYATGSIFALHTASSAQILWRAGRAEAAYGLWQALIQESMVDAAGHLHEVFAGNFYREQMESVPEQTWSSAGLLSATLGGMFGLEVRVGRDEVRVAPHLPAEWARASLRNIHTAHAALDLDLERGDGEMRLRVHNGGEKARIVYTPSLPLGARWLSAQCGGKAVEGPAGAKATRKDASGQEYTLEAGRGESECTIRYAGGLELMVDHPILKAGDPSIGMKVKHVALTDGALEIDADVHRGTETHFSVKTGWRLASGEGVQLLKQEAGVAVFAVEAPAARADALGYAAVRLRIPVTEGSTPAHRFGKSAKAH